VLQTVQNVRSIGNTRDIAEEQVLVFTGPGSATLKAVQSSGSGYAAETTTDLTNWKVITDNIYDIACDSTGQIIYRSFLNGVNPVQKSIDFGETWTNILASQYGYEELVTSANGMIVVSDYNYSLDGGETWSSYQNAYFTYTEGEGMYRMRMNNSGSKWFAMGDYRLFVSTNYGATWQTVGPTLSGVMWNDIAMSDGGNTLMACAQGKIYVSVSGGSWNQRAPAGTSNMDFYSMCCNALGSIIYTTVRSSTGRIYKSTDYGLNWVPRGASRGWRGIACDAEGKIVIAGEDPGRLNSEIYTSLDEMNTWVARVVIKPGFGQLRSFDRIRLSRNGAKRVFVSTGPGNANSTLLMATRTSQDITFRLAQTVEFVESYTSEIRALSFDDMKMDIESETLDSNIGETLVEEEQIVIESVLQDLNADESFDVVFTEPEPVELNTNMNNMNMNIIQSRDIVMVSSGTLTISNALAGDVISLDGLAVSDTMESNPIFYTTSPTDSVSISNGNTMTILAPGSFTLYAYQGSFDYYSESNTAQKQVEITFANSISFTENPIQKTLGDAPFTPEISTVNNAAYTFSVPANNGVATTNGTTITIIGAGTVTLTVSQPANPIYASTTATTTLNVAKGTQTLTFNNMTKGYGETFVPVVSTNASPSYSSYSFSVPNNNGVATSNGSSITVIGLGTVQITATQATNTNYLQATATATLTAVKGTQALTFNNIYKNENSDPFVPVISTSANPSYSSYTFSVPEGNGVASTDGSVITVLGMGTVEITASQAQNSLYNSATATTTLKVISGLKRVQINLWDLSTDTEQFFMSQNLDSTQMQFTHSVNFRQPSRGLVVSDVIDYFDRVDTADSNISSLEIRKTVASNTLNNLSNKADTNEQDIDSLESRITTIEQDVLDRTLDADGYESILFILDNDLDTIEERVIQRDSVLNVHEQRLDELDIQMDWIDSEIQDLFVRQDTIESNISLLDTQTDSIESRIDQVESRADQMDIRNTELFSRTIQSESRISDLELRLDASTESIQFLDTRLSQTESGVQVFETRQDIIEIDIDTIDSRMDSSEYVSNQIQSVLFAMTDGTIEGYLSSLQNIAHQFQNSSHAEEDLQDLQERIAIVDSVLKLLLEESL
jgi:hypothetical protein